MNLNILIKIDKQDIKIVTYIVQRSGCWSIVCYNCPFGINNYKEYETRFCDEFSSKRGISTIESRKQLAKWFLKECEKLSNAENLLNGVDIDDFK